MDYMQMRHQLGVELVEPIEDAVLKALAHTRQDVESQEALRQILVSLLGAVVWVRTEPDKIAAAEAQCTRDLSSALQALAKDDHDQAGKGMN